jgi:hypothetical protein
MFETISNGIEKTDIKLSSYKCDEQNSIRGLRISYSLPDLWTLLNLKSTPFAGHALWDTQLSLANCESEVLHILRNDFPKSPQALDEQPFPSLRQLAKRILIPMTTIQYHLVNRIGAHPQGFGGSKNRPESPLQDLS